MQANAIRFLSDKRREESLCEGGMRTSIFLIKSNLVPDVHQIASAYL